MKTIETIFADLELGSDSIYSYEFSNTEQTEEIELRKSAVASKCKDYLNQISKHHSVPVMDKEVDLFLRQIPSGGIIIDVGGCWGWHWRRIKNTRPDVTVFIVDFVREALVQAKDFLGEQINKNIFLVHGDANSLKFKDNTFDGYWSVQTLQHIPNFRKAIEEAHRILKPEGVFANYSLNTLQLVRVIYKIIGRPYHIKGIVPGAFYLSRASKEQVSVVREVFSNTVTRRFTELLFKPELKICFLGKENSIAGKFDSLLSSKNPIYSHIARQQSYHTAKISLLSSHEKYAELF